MPQTPAYGAAAPAMAHFTAGEAGQWRITRQSAPIGEGLAQAASIAINSPASDALWTLTGFTSNLRYTTFDERGPLDARSDPLGRPEARHAALIPIRKSSRWWALAQDERRAIYARSQHMPIGLDYLPQVARRRYHCRDLGQPFDFLTWFEFPESSGAAFDELVMRLRATEEWEYVEREIDIRLIRNI